MLWMLAGCVTGQVRVSGVEATSPTEGVDVEPVTPVLEPVTPGLDPGSCDPMADRGTVAPSWILELDEYSVSPEGLAYTEDGAFLRFVSDAMVHEVASDGSGLRPTSPVGTYAAMSETGELTVREERTVVLQDEAGEHTLLTLPEFAWVRYAALNETWVVVETSDRRYTIERQTGDVASVPLEGWPGIDRALSGDDLWGLDGTILERIDLRTGVVESRDLARHVGVVPEDTWEPDVFGLTIGPAGPVFTTAASQRVHLDHDGAVLYVLDAGYTPVNRQIYAEPWTAGPVAWSADERLRVDLDEDGGMQVRQVCSGNDVLRLEPVELERWGIPMGTIAASWSPSGEQIVLRMERAVVAYPFVTGGL